MKNTQKTLQKQVEDLQKQFEALDSKYTQKSEARQKELEALKAFQRWEHKDYPEDIERTERRLARDRRLYEPMRQAIDDDELDITSYIYDWSTPDEVVEFVEDHEREIIDNQSEIIYYSEAMDYLHENDQTLTEALELAYNAGYDLKNLNSCILASLLKQEDENMYWKFNEDLEALKDKAEEINEEREEIEEKTGKKIEDIIEDEAQDKAQAKIKELWKPEELKAYEEQKAKYDESIEESQKARKERAKAREDLEAKKKELEALQNN